MFLYESLIKEGTQRQREREREGEEGTLTTAIYMCTYTHVHTVENFMALVPHVPFECTVQEKPIHVFTCLGWSARFKHVFNQS